MEKTMMNIEKDIGALYESVKSAHKRIDTLEPVVKTIYELASSVKVLAEKMNNMDGTIVQIQSNIEEYHHKEPNKLWFNIKNAIAVGVVGALIGALMTLIIK